MKVLSVVASPRGKESRTYSVTQEFLNILIMGSDDLTVQTVDLNEEDLPSTHGLGIEAMHRSRGDRLEGKRHEDAWTRIETIIEDFLRADLILITTPMWNLTVPYTLKHYIDCLVQPGYTYAYDYDESVIPLATGKKMVIFTSRGCDYSDGAPIAAQDYLEPYLRTIFRSIGVKDIEFVNAQPTDTNPQERALAIQDASDRAREIASKIMGADAPPRRYVENRA